MTYRNKLKLGTFLSKVRVILFFSSSSSSQKNFLGKKKLQTELWWMFHRKMLYKLTGQITPFFSIRQTAASASRVLRYIKKDITSFIWVKLISWFDCAITIFALYYSCFIMIYNKHGYLQFQYLQHTPRPNWALESTQWLNTFVPKILKYSAVRAIYLGGYILVY